jgi:hypothetical protein
MGMALSLHFFEILDSIESRNEKANHIGPFLKSKKIFSVGNFFRDILRGYSQKIAPLLFAL